MEQEGLMQLMEDWKGYASIDERGRPTKAQAAAFYDLLGNVRKVPAHRHEYEIREAMTTDSFPLMFADVIDRQLLAAYVAIDPMWKMYMRVKTVNRLHPWIGAKRFAITMSGMYLGEVPEKGEYLALKKTEKKYDIYAKKYGNQIDISWEAVIADKLGALKDTPSEFAWLAANTEHYNAVNLYANDLNILGTHALGDLYDDTTAGEINATTLPLTIANLEATVAAMQAFRHPSGQPMRNKPKYLVVSDGGLEFTAQQILTSASKMWLDYTTREAGPINYAMPTTNVIAQYGLELIIDPWLSIAGLDGYTANTWYLFADPGNIAAIECDYLEGHERPEICMKASDKVTLGGGAINPMSGDFATDNIFYRVRQCFGANKLDWRATFINTVAD